MSKQETKQKTGPKQKPYASLRSLKIHFEVKFFCDNEMKMNMTIRDFNKLKKQAEHINAEKDLANVLQDAIQDRVPKGIGVTVAPFEEWRRYR